MADDKQLSATSIVLEFLCAASCLVVPVILVTALHYALTVSR